MNAINMLASYKASIERKQLALAQQIQEKEDQVRTAFGDYCNIPYYLHAILIHDGTAESGHYYSFIREHKAADKQGAEEKWYEFNDNVVRDFDVADLPNECFGGEEFYSGPGMSNMKTPKWRNAYLVIYERKSQEEAHAEEEENQN